MKSTTKAKRLPADLQTAVDTQFQRSWQVKREDLTSMIMLPSAAGNAPSMVWIAILAASLAYLNHTCCKFGESCPTCCKFGSAIMTIQLGAIPAARAWQRYSSSTSLAALFQQRQLGSTKAIKEFQVSRLKIKTICITGGFGAHASSLRLRVALMYIDCFTTHLQNLYIIQTQF